jgi:type IV pilus assembly protein PilE
MKSREGFTLIELMIVLVVIAILASIAVPSYSDYVIRGKLVEGTSALSDGRVKMEQFFQDNRTYVGGPAPATTTNFAYAAGDLSLTTYTITASGNGRMAGFVYTIDQTNTKRTTAAPAGWGTTTMPGIPATCWIGKKSGVC